MEEQLEIEYLDVDQPIRGQEYVLLSFVVPKSSLQEQKESFLFESYLKDKKEKFNTVIEEELNLSGKTEAELKQDRALLIEKLFESESSLIEDYQGFKKLYSEKLNAEFSKSVKDVTHITGLKVRGTYGTESEARSKANKLQKLDKYHNIYVAQVGYWLPFNPNPDEIGDDEYQEPKLNEIMKGYRENKEQTKQHFEERKKHMAEEAIRIAQQQKEENEKLLLEENQSNDNNIEEVVENTSETPNETSSENLKVSTSDEFKTMMDSFENQPFMGSSSMQQ